jgi:hypothetical protein
MMGRDQVSVNGEPQDSQTVVEVVFPNGSVPLSRTTFEQFAAPDVVDEHVDVAMVVANLLGQSVHLVRFEMVDRDCDTSAAELRDEVGSLFDGLATVVVGPDCSCAATATCANDRRTSFAQGSGDSTPSASGRPCNDGHASAQRVSIWRPVHSRSLPAGRSCRQGVKVSVVSARRLSSSDRTVS